MPLVLHVFEFKMATDFHRSNNKSLGKLENSQKLKIWKQDTQPNLTSRATRERKAKHKVSRRKEMIKIRAEINEIETKKIIKIDQWS